MGNASNNSGYGFRVLKTQPHSPAHESGLQPFLDFIVNIELSQSETKEANISNIQAFFNTIKSNENREIHVTVFNIYDRQLRKIRMIPNKSWPDADSLLGALLRYEEYITALERTYKVIQVVPNSVSEKIGFVENFDYVLGITNYLYKDLNDFIRCLFKADEVCVLNVKENKLKFITIPKEKCLLGCQFGEGILNQLPYKSYESPMIEEILKPSEEEIVTLTEDPPVNYDKNEKNEENLQHNSPATIKTPSPKKIIEAPPKKSELSKEIEQKPIVLEDNQEAKNYEELLKPTCSKSTLEFIHHKRSENLKKNGHHSGNQRFTPKNPFSSPKNMNIVENQDQKEKMDKNENNSKSLDKFNLEEKNENIEENYEKKNEIKENLNIIEEENKHLNLESSQNQKKQNKEEKIGKMQMKYSYYCPKIKNEYVINSGDLVILNQILE